MADEEKIQAELVARFGYLKDKIQIPRARRLFVQVTAAQAQEIVREAFADMGFTIMCTITGLDLGEEMAAIYHVARPSGEVLNIEARVPKAQPILQTVSDLFPPADAYERELIDLLGFQVQGLPPGNRYPLPDGWPANQYPLRKEWKTEMLGDMSFPCVTTPAEKAVPPKEVKNG